MTLPKAISDAIDAYREKVWHRTQAQLSFYTGTADREGCMSEEGKARAALERAIAEHVADAGKMVSVAAPTEAEIEAWEKVATNGRKSMHAYVIGKPQIDEAVALMRQAAGGPTVTALMRGVEDAAIEWVKCVVDYNASCQAAPPPSGLEASEAVRKAGHKCELAYGYFQKAITALADHRATPAPSVLERLREREAKR